MIKILKYTGLIIFGLLFCGFLSLQWIMNWSPEARNTKIRRNNLKQVSKGMSKIEFIRILGEPDLEQVSKNENLDTTYYYKTPFLNSGYIEVHTVNGKVVSTYDGN